MDPKQSDALTRVMDLVRYLRAHCPWDAAQTSRSLIPYLLEEAHETADAIADGDDGALRSELGDLLLNVAFQLVIAEEDDRFDAGAVADTVIAKMERRHPHLFGGGGEPEDWESLKALERDDDASLLHGVAKSLDPLSRAHRIQDRVAGVGFDWDDAMGAFEKVAEELEEVRVALEAVRIGTGDRSDLDHGSDVDAGSDTDRGRAIDGVSDAAPTRRESSPSGPADAALEEELGDLLFAVVNLTRLAGAHALTALHGANAKFTRRFQALEALAAERDVGLQSASLDELEALWQEVKAGES
ncbi:MAG: MazG nucleotide pyrophosphohydrolase domain-containing protein [Longimicrobiales bacterium]|nr:MazG nucleotide pyrophosphohydrolase domain-containing protein [Longimicrobiales bacterium]